MGSLIRYFQEDASGRPIVDAGEVFLAADAHFVVYGEDIPAPKGGLNRYTRSRLARLWRAGPGLYLSDVDGVGKPLAPAELETAEKDWPYQTPEKAPAMPSSLGLDDPRPCGPPKVAFVPG